MSCPAGRFSSSIFAVKSLSGRAAIGGSALASLNDSVVETSTSICEGRSARAHTTPPSALTSPDCTPWVTTGRSAARDRRGIAMRLAAAAPYLMNRRREILREKPVFMRALGAILRVIAHETYEDNVTARLPPLSNVARNEIGRVRHGAASRYQPRRSRCFSSAGGYSDQSRRFSSDRKWAPAPSRRWKNTAPYRDPRYTRPGKSSFGRPGRN